MENREGDQEEECPLHCVSPHQYLHQDVPPLALYILSAHQHESEGRRGLRRCSATPFFDGIVIMNETSAPLQVAATIGTTVHYFVTFIFQYFFYKIMW